MPSLTLGPGVCQNDTLHHKLLSSSNSRSSLSLRVRQPKMQVNFQDTGCALVRAMLVSPAGCGHSILAIVGGPARGTGCNGDSL
jgi:hypothetical protein